MSAGRPAVVEPLFTFYGYRYINVTGWPGDVDPAAFEGVSLYTDLPRTGWLETGNDKVNRLFENALWSQRDNFLDVPTRSARLWLDGGRPGVYFHRVL